jgi:hypothetical protein
MGSGESTESDLTPHERENRELRLRREKEYLEQYEQRRQDTLQREKERRERTEAIARQERTEAMKRRERIEAIARQEGIEAMKRQEEALKRRNRFEEAILSTQLEAKRKEEANRHAHLLRDEALRKEALVQREQERLAILHEREQLARIHAKRIENQRQEKLRQAPRQYHANEEQFKCACCRKEMSRSEFSKNQLSKCAARKCKTCIQNTLSSQVNMSTTSDLECYEYYCTSCEQTKSGNEFSKTQLRSVEYRRCIGCVGQASGAQGFVLIDAKHFAEGSSRYAYKAIEKSSGDLVVVKQFKKIHPTEKMFWDADIKTHQLAKDLVEIWNDLNSTSKSYEITSPTRAYMKFVDKTGVFVMGEWVLVEKFIDGNWEKFNSNSGWVGNSETSVQAFCHWTYHYSGGKYLFCDAQGARDHIGYYLTDPCIMSVTKEYGITDLGSEGISIWFSNHTCNKFCQKHWLRPQFRSTRPVYFEKSTTYRNEFSSLATNHDDDDYY